MNTRPTRTWLWFAVMALVLAGIVGSLVVGVATVASRADEVAGLRQVRPGTSVRLLLEAGAQVVVVEARCDAEDACDEVRVPTVIVLAADGAPVTLEASSAFSARATDGRAMGRVATFEISDAGQFSVVVGTARDPRVAALAIGADPLDDRWALLWPPLLVTALFWLAAAALVVGILRRRPQPALAQTNEGGPE
jgi:hypothetical protein